MNAPLHALRRERESIERRIAENRGWLAEVMKRGAVYRTTIAKLRLELAEIDDAIAVLGGEEETG